MDFYTSAASYLDAFQSDMKQNFHLIQNAEYHDRRFPLYAILELEETATLISKNGKSVWSYEFCYFDACEHLDEDAVRYYCNVLDDMAANYVPWQEFSHSFSMVSMVVLADSAPDRNLLKLIRKYKHEEKRKPAKNGYGWCSCRLCIVDMSTGTCYTNKHGGALGNRTSNSIKKVGAF